MYEYKVVSVGDVRELRRRMRASVPIQEAESPEEGGALEEALNHWAQKGWRLVNVVQTDPRMMMLLCVFERNTEKAGCECLAKP